MHNEETLLYKKLDSTLRGNVGAELAAVLEARRALSPTGKRIVAVLAPAFPAHGRTTLNGRQLIHGRHLEEAEHNRHELTVARSDISAMMHEAGLAPALLGLDLIRCGTGVLGHAMQTMAQDSDVLVCDAETGEDLREIADASMALGRGTVWAGSAGLAYHLPAAAGLARTAISLPEQALATGPTLFVIGSGSSVSRKQVEVLASWSDVVLVKIAPDVLLSGEDSPDWKAHREALERALDAGKDVAVLPSAAPRHDSAHGQQLCAGLGKLVRPFADKVGSLVTTGGETTRTLFESWGVSKLRLMSEVETGLPFSVTVGWRRELAVLTKAGGFGRPETLLNCRKFLQELDRRGAVDRGKS